MVDMFKILFDITKKMISNQFYFISTDLIKDEIISNYKLLVSKILNF